MADYTTLDGDVLDAICHRHYGHTRWVERVLEANHELARRGPVYGAGEHITLPDIPAAVSVGTIRLWD